MSEASRVRPTDPLGLRLFQPDQPSTQRPIDRLSPQMRLEQLWTQYGKPVVCRAKGLSPKSVELYQIAVDYWTQLTADRPLEEIGELDAADYLEGLRLQPGLKNEFLAPSTVARRAKDLQRVLDLAGPRSRHGEWGPYGKGLVEAVPYVEPPKVPDSLPEGDFTHEEVLAILKACPSGKVHEGYPGHPAVFWTALITFLCATGLRITETMELRWEYIDRQMLFIPAAIAKTKRGRHKYLPQAALAAIEPLRGLESPGKGGRIFAWPNWPSAGAWRWLHRRRRQLVAAAGLPEHRWFGFHGFRKYHGTQLEELDDSRGDQASVAQLSLGHTEEAVTMGHYVNIHTQQGKDLKRQQAVVDRMPLFRQQDQLPPPARTVSRPTLQVCVMRAGAFFLHSSAGGIAAATRRRSASLLATRTGALFSFTLRPLSARSRSGRPAPPRR